MILRNIQNGGIIECEKTPSGTDILKGITIDCCCCDPCQISLDNPFIVIDRRYFIIK
jgi:hypothetical protein